MGLPFCCCLLCQELHTIKTLGLRYPPYATQQPTVIIVQGGGQVPQQQFMYAQQPGMPPHQIALPQQQPGLQGYSAAQAYPAPQANLQQESSPHWQPPPGNFPQAQVVGYDTTGMKAQ